MECYSPDLHRNNLFFNRLEQFPFFFKKAILSSSVATNLSIHILSVNMTKNSYFQFGMGFISCS